MIIAIDGFSSCGKSTLAKDIAKKLSYVYVDSGAMYRATTLYFIRNKVSLDAPKAIEKALNNINISFRIEDGENLCILNDHVVEEEIRSMEISDLVSEVAAIPAVRRQMVEQQRLISEGHDVVMDGRDIGTVVFPHADVKFFVTADKEVRAQRRYQELLGKGKEVTLDQVIKNLAHRDFIDTTRETSPLRQAEDAIVIDNTCLDRADQLKLALEYIQSIKKMNT